MPSFTYQSIDRSGGTHVGAVVAPDRASALRMLQTRGLTPVALDQEHDAADSTTAPPTPARSGPGLVVQSADGATDVLATLRALVGSRTGRPVLKRTELANMVRELATAIEAGLPLLNALKITRKQASGKAQPVILDFLIRYVEAGRPLHEAMAEYGPPFDEMIVGMVRAADASGRTSEVLHQLADLLDRSVELRRELMGAVLYPFIVAGVIAVSIVILVTYVLPNIMSSQVERVGAAGLPLPTRMLLGFSDFMQTWWIGVLLAAIAAYVLVRHWTTVPQNRRRIDLLLLRMPLLGNLLRDVAVARFTRTLGTLVSAGLPILQALRIVRDTLGNTILMDAVDQVQEKVTTGQSLAEPLERCGFFPPLLVQIVNIGEKSGRLESMLLHAAVAFDRQVNTSLKVFAKVLPPVLVAIMACVAAFVLLAILLPLMDAMNAVSRGL